MLKKLASSNLARHRGFRPKLTNDSFFGAVEGRWDQTTSRSGVTDNYHVNRVIERNFSSSASSDRLMGYSPMSPSTPIPSTPENKINEDGTLVKRIPTAQEVSTTGGVWAPTSAKRDKLGELRVALKEDQESLDDAATPEQRLDLYLADGLRLMAQVTDGLAVEEFESIKQLQDLSEWLVGEQSRQPEFFYDEEQFTAHMDVVSEKIAGLLADLSPQSLEEVRDFFDPEEAIAEEISKLKESELQLQDTNFQEATLRLRLLLAKAAAEHAKASWKGLTTVSDADVDRAAVKGEVVPPQTVSLAKVYKYVFTHASGACSDRVDAAWALVDRDDDGLLDESEISEMAFLCLSPVQMALKSLFEEALEASDVRSPLPEIGSETVPEPPPKSWNQRRKDKKVKKQLQKLLENATKNHFQDEVEINHRLRCIYAWAEKEHQDNKLDSVLVDEGWTGRKRYVELSPKISLPEFREVQAEHFTHLDRMGKEILKSFREDLWVTQGKGRERSELMRDCFAFLTVVSVADYLILLS
jgi:hypothetical protein